MSRQVFALGVVSLSLLAAAPPASAADKTYDRFFFGASLGRAELDEDVDEFDDDDSSFGVRLFGGYNFTRYLGAEVAYVSLDQFNSITYDSETGEADIDPGAEGPTLAARATLPLTDRFALTARAGVFFWDANRLEEDEGQLRREDDEDSDPFFGAGVEATITSWFALRGFYERYEVDDADLDYVGLDMEFRF